MTISDLLNHTASRLRNAGIDQPRLDAEVLLAALLNKNRVWFYAHGQDELDDEQLRGYDAMIVRRLQHEPIAYIIGHREFMGLNFYVDPAVLIPRPDTECVVEAALNVLKAKKDHLRFLDLCTGSGAIGLAVKHYSPQTEVTLSDISEAALQVARRNAEALQLDVRCVHSDLFEKISERFDMIVSNPPYIPAKVIQTLDSDVKDYEPLSALDGGESGFDLYEKIIKQAGDHLNTGGCLILESGHDQGEQLCRMMTDAGFEVNIKQSDLAGFLRCVGGTKKI